mmetsp:Transcript_8310/g.10579  ORF Transcript_8310/g.10579 Transcript_8310/m.10579 type:complete len:145 (-) Transcript_8310:45-479(-)
MEIIVIRGGFDVCQFRFDFNKAFLQIVYRRFKHAVEWAFTLYFWFYRSVGSLRFRWHILTDILGSMTSGFFNAQNQGIVVIFHGVNVPVDKQEKVYQVLADILEVIKKVLDNFLFCIIVLCLCSKQDTKCNLKKGPCDTGKVYM